MNAFTQTPLREYLDAFVCTTCGCVVDAVDSEGTCEDCYFEAYANWHEEHKQELIAKMIELGDDRAWFTGNDSEY